jgi:hypothetical protein
MKPFKLMIEYDGKIWGGTLKISHTKSISNKTLNNIIEKELKIFLNKSLKELKNYIKENI